MYYRYVSSEQPLEVPQYERILGWREVGSGVLTVVLFFLAVAAFFLWIFTRDEFFSQLSFLTAVAAVIAGTICYWICFR